jgi:HK97 family phage major capsid protein
LGVTASTATSLTFANLVDLQHSVDRAYRDDPSCAFMLHDATLAVIKKMVDSQNRPLFIPGVALGAPDTILGKPYIVNNHVAQQGASAKTILFGPGRYYTIRDVLDVQLQRLDERYAEYRQVAFVAFLRTDGDLIAAGTPIKYLQQGSGT